MWRVDILGKLCYNTCGDWSGKSSWEDGSKFYQYDGLGSTRKIMLADETLDAAVIYDAWGNIESGSADADAYLWVGRLGYRRDGDLYHLRARMYDPTQGRFLTKDPIIPASALQTLLQYAANSPLRFTDPWGRQLFPVNDPRCWKDGVKDCICDIAEDQFADLIAELAVTLALDLTPPDGNRPCKAFAALAGKFTGRIKGYVVWSNGDAFPCVFDCNRQYAQIGYAFYPCFKKDELCKRDGDSMADPWRRGPLPVKYSLFRDCSRWNKKSQLKGVQGQLDLNPGSLSFSGRIKILWWTCQKKAEGQAEEAPALPIMVI